jgi:hypothetical protein
MSVIKVTSAQFVGTSKIFSRESTGLAAIIRGIAIDNARTRIEGSQVPHITDNTTGAAMAGFIDPTNPAILTGVFNASVSGGVSTTAFNASLVKIANATLVMVNAINNARARLGYGVITQPDGTQAAANVLPALDLTATTASGTASLNYASATAAIKLVRQNQYTLARYFNEVLVAIGEPALSSTIQVNMPLQPQNFMNATPVILADTVNGGVTSVALADATAFLAEIASNFATMALRWNNAMSQGPMATITDSTGGTPATTLVVNAAPAAATGAATTSAPKAGFDAQLVIIANAISSLASKTNQLITFYDLPALVDSTGGTISTTLAAESVALTAVDGSTGTNAVDVVTATARMATIENSLTSIGAQLNAVAGNFGDMSLVMNNGGTASQTLAALPATATGVGGGTLSTMLDTAVNTWLTNNRNNISTLAAFLNTMLGSTQSNKPLHVVAG